MKRLLAFCVLTALMLGVPPASAETPPSGYTRAGSTQNVFFYGDKGYQIEYRYDCENKFRDTVASYVDNYNEYLAGDDIDVYFYFVNNSRSIDFSAAIPCPNDIYLDLCRRLTCVDHADSLTVDSFDAYMRLYYQTDHHWNHIGAQQGYEDIVRLLLGDDETPYQPVDEIVFDVMFNGSYTQRSGIFSATQPFAVYLYDLPPVTSTVEGKKKVIGREKQYLDGKYARSEGTAHNVVFYGGDFGEIVYDTGCEEKENLLILSNSYGCSVRQLISRHFNKTYAVDMRHYLAQKGGGMRIREYLRDNDIDKVLILGDISLFLYGKYLH